MNKARFSGKTQDN